MKNHQLRVGWSLVVIVVMLTGSCVPDPSPFQLIEADRAFNDAVAEGGSEAWAEWFAEEGALIQPGVGEIRGPEAIREAVTYLDDPAISLTWEPLRADIARSGDLGWTTGHYTVETTADDGSVQRNEGRYVSIWRRQGDGTWRVVMDLGNPTSGAS